MSELRSKSLLLLALLALFFFLLRDVLPGVIFLAAAVWRGQYLHHRSTTSNLISSKERERRRQEAIKEQERRDILAVSRGPRPTPSLIRTYRDAEEAATQWMRWLGWGDASVTPQGKDGGIDVIATHAVAQVKAHVNPIGRPEIQKLYGVATDLRRTPLFFASAGYTPDATSWASRVSMALFRFDLQGQPEPVNEVARELWENGAFPLGAPNSEEREE